MHSIDGRHTTTHSQIEKRRLCVRPGRSHETRGRSSHHVIGESGKRLTKNYGHTEHKRQLGVSSKVGHETQCRSSDHVSGDYGDDFNDNESLKLGHKKVVPPGSLRHAGSECVRNYDDPFKAYEDISSGSSEEQPARGSLLQVVQTAVGVELNQRVLMMIPL